MDERVRYIPCRLTIYLQKKFQHYSSLWSNVSKITSFWGHFFKVLSKCICHLSLSFCWSVNSNYLHHHGSGECPHSDNFAGNVWSNPWGGDAPTEYSFFSPWYQMQHVVHFRIVPCCWNRNFSYSVWEITQTLSILSDGTKTASVGGKRVDGRSRQANTFIIVIRSGQFGVTNGLYSVPAPGQKLELLDIYSGQSRSPPPPTVRLPNTPVLCPGKF